MASVQDVFDQLEAANRSLVTIHDDETALGRDVSEVRDAVHNVNATLNAGFTVVSGGMQVLARELHQIDTTLLHISAQTDTVICYLEKIAKLSCAILNEAVVQSRRQAAIEESLEDLRHMFTTAHPAAALELARYREAERRLERCCPTATSEPPCVHVPCPTSEPVREEPVPWEFPPFEPSAPVV